MPGVGPGFIGPAPYPFALEQVEEALDHRVVMTVPASTLSDQNYGRFCDRLRVVEYHQFLGVSRAAINRYFNLIGVSLTVPAGGLECEAEEASR